MVLLITKDNAQKVKRLKGQKGKPFCLFTFLPLCLLTTFCLFTSPAFAEEKVYRINIEGMHCKTCIYRVTKSLKKLKEVKDVKVDLDSETATVILYDGEDLATSDLEEAVEDSGYSPRGVEVIGANDNSTDNKGEVGK